MIIEVDGRKRTAVTARTPDVEGRAALGTAGVHRPSVARQVP